MPGKNPPGPLRLVTSQIPANTKALIVQLSQSVRRIDGIISELPPSTQAHNLALAIDRLTETTGGVVSTLLSLAEKNDDKNRHITNTNAILLDNISIMQKLHNLNKGLWSNKIDTILEAIIYIEKTTREQFPGISTKILLTPCHDEQGCPIENPIAQMLADSIEMSHARFSDNDSDATPQEKSQINKLNHLISLLPIITGALKKDTLPSEIHTVGMTNTFTCEDNPSHILSQEEVLRLDPLVFGKPGSVLAHRIPDIGEIIFLSENPDHYDPGQDTFILTNAIENLGIFLAYIGKDEKNKKDLLTGLPGRRGFEEKASRLFHLAQEKDEPISFAFIDADHFKKVNDNYGHMAGDLVLKTLAKILIQKLKAEDLQVRWGGEEFGVLLQSDTESARIAIQRVFDVIARISFQVNAEGIPSIVNGTELTGNKIFSITLSAGIAGNKDHTMHSDKSHPIISEMTLEDIIRRADERLYIAKNTGRNRIVTK